MSRTPPPTTRGQSLVEFALVAGIFLFLVGAALNTAGYFAVRYAVAQAASEAAHQAALLGGPDGPDGPLAAGRGQVAHTARLVLSYSLLTQPDQATLTVACPAQCRRYQPIQVTIQYTGSYLVGIPGLFERYHITQQAVRAAEQDRVAGGQP